MDGLEKSARKLSPESIEAILNKQIDIEQFSGLLVWTQVPNVPNILKKGFRSPKERDAPHWKYGGAVDTGAVWGNQDGFYITLYDSRYHSFRNGDYPWPTAGQVGVLIDPSADEEIFRQLQAVLESAHRGSLSAETVQNFKTNTLDPNFVRGMIWNELSNQLLNPKDTHSRTMPLPEGGVDTIKVPQRFNFTNEEYQQMLFRRLERLAGTPHEKNLVPVYANSGEVLWPRRK